MSDVRTRFHSDNDIVHFERIQDVEPIIEHNKLLRSMPQKSDWGRHVWNLPNVMYEKFFKEYNEGRSKPDLRLFGPEFTQYVNKRMQDPEFAAFRTDDRSTSYRIGYR
jgi:hypothetical protein